MKITKNVWTAILLWMALCSFTLSAQEGGTETIINLANLTNGSSIITTAGTYRFKGTYSGIPTAAIEQSDGTAVISVETSDDVTIILENVTISLSGDKECPLSARNATGKVTVQLKGTNKLETTNTSSDQCPALWAPEPPNGNGELIIMNLEGNEGSLTATARDAWDAPGIGSKGTQGSHITIKSGKITANGGYQGAGIGGGNGGNGGTITISGGTVTANGGYQGAGIGGGYKGAGGTIIITNGTVKATGGKGAAGIGGGYKGAGGTITISGGNVTAKSVYGGAGIGGGYFYGDGGTITITNGTVKATGVYGGAGIGGGYLGAGGTITISGGTVQEAKGGESGAGIGGGYLGDGGTITITKGTVTAKGGENSTAAGIGCGDGYNGSGGTITITEGEVKATNGNNNSTGTPDIKGNTVVVGPDATMQKDNSGTLEYNYTNGFVFKDKKAEVKGDATLLANIIIDSGEELTIPAGKSLTIEAGVTLTNNGTITNKGTIKNAGTIIGEVSNEGSMLTKLTASMITINPATYTYTGSAIIPGVTVSPSGTPYTDADYAHTFAINTDYTLEYANNRDAAELTADNPPTVTVIPTPTGKLYGDAVSMMFTIQPKPLSFTFKGLDNLTYDGAGHKATVSTTDLVAGDNVEPTLVYQKKGENKVFADIEGLPTDAGTYKVIVKSVDNPNYTVNEAYNYTEFTIAQATTSIDAFAEIDNKIYNGIAINITAPAVTGVGLTDVKAKLTYKTKDAEDATYTETAPKDAGSYTVKATYAGDGNHEEANETADFTIKPKELTAAMVKLDPESFTYNGREQRPEVTVMDGDLMTANDYAISYSDGSTIVGTYTVTVTGQGNYQGRQAKNYSIKKATPASPTNLTATYGQTLDDVELPEGWTWRDATTTPVGDVGTNKFHAKYTPSDTHNYNEVADAEVSIEVAPANANLSFAQPTLTLTEGDAVPANALTKPEDCEVTYESSNEEVATVEAATGEVTVVGVGTTTITAKAGGNYTGTATYTLTVNRYTPPYIPPTDPVYYTVTIPTEVKGAIIHGGGTHEVEEGSNYSFRIELDPNGSGEYPTVMKDYEWNTITPDGQGYYGFVVTDNTKIIIGELPTRSYSNYQLSVPTDSVAESDNQYWSGNYIEVMGVSLLRATEETMTLYDVPFGTTVTLRPIETAERKFLQWEDGSTDRERTLTLRADKEINALWQTISAVGIEEIAANSLIRGERGQLYIEVPIPCDVVIYNYNGVPVRRAHLTEGSNRIHSLNAGLYLVRIGGASAVPVRVR